MKNTIAIYSAIGLVIVLALVVREIIAAETPRQYGCVEQEYKTSFTDEGVYLYTFVWYKDKIINLERDREGCVTDSVKQVRREEGLQLLKTLKDEK